MDKRIVILLLLLALSACTQAGSPSPTPVPIQYFAVTPNLEDLASAWLGAYSQETDTRSIDLEVLAFQIAVDKPGTGLILTFQQPPEGWFVTPITRMPIAIILNPENPNRSLAVEDLENLFSGRIQTWEGFPGTQTRVQPVVSLPGDPLRAWFDRVVMRGSSIAPYALQSSSPSKMIEIIRDHPGAIGLLPLLEPETRMRVASLNGVSPTREAVENGTYPLWVDVLAIAPEEPAGPLRDFLQWLQETKPYDK